MKISHVVKILFIIAIIVASFGLIAAAPLQGEAPPEPTAEPGGVPTILTPADEIPPVPTAPSPDTLADILSLVTQFASLAGVATLIAALVNVLKLTPLIKDGQTGPWYAALSLVAFAALVFFRVVKGVDTSALNVQAAQVAAVLMFVTGYVAQLGFGQAANRVLKQIDVPGVSTSFTPTDQKGKVGI